MDKYEWFFGVIFLVVLLNACVFDKFTEVNSSVPQKQINIECYSGGNKIYEAKAIRDVLNETGSNIYRFRDKGGLLMEVGGDCIVQLMDMLKKE